MIWWIYKCFLNYFGNRKLFLRKPALLPMRSAWSENSSHNQQDYSQPLFKSWLIYANLKDSSCKLNRRLAKRNCLFHPFTSLNSQYLDGSMREWRNSSVLTIKLFLALTHRSVNAQNKIRILRTVPYVIFSWKDCWIFMILCNDRWILGPLLLTWFNINPNMDKQLHAQHV